MEIEIIPVTREHETTFRNLYQFYLYDFSEMIGFPVNPDGLYPDEDSDTLWDPGVNGFLLRIEGELAGLAMVDDWRKNPNASEPIIYLAEFFVLRKFRKRGVGEAFATALFDRFRGRWRVSQVLENSYAHRFWRRVIGNYTNNNFEDTRVDRGDRIVTVQTFDNSLK